MLLTLCERNIVKPSASTLALEFRYRQKHQAQQGQAPTECAQNAAGSFTGVSLY